MRLPNSPAVSRAVSAQKAWVSSQYKSLSKKANLKNKIPLLRQDLGQVGIIHLLILIFEAYGLSRITLPTVPVVTPSWDTAKVPATTFKVIDFRVLLTSAFWAPTTLWLLTSVIVPGAASWLVNLTYNNPAPRTRRTKPQREFDPLIFSIVKFLTAWVVYAHGASFRFFGLYNDSTVAAVNTGVYGGFSTFLIGSAIGVITALSDNLSFKS